MRFFDGSEVISLLRRVTVLWSFIRNWNHDLCCVRVPPVVVLGWRVTWNVARCVLPREASPVRSWAPIFAGVSRVGVSVVHCSWELSNAARVVARELAKWCVSWTCVLVLTSAVSGTCSTRECVAESVDGFVHSHVCGFEHWLDALEVTARCEVATVNNGADVSPLGIHRTRGVDDESEFNFTATGVIPCDLDVVVGVNNNVWMSFVADDWREEGVIEKGDN